MLGQSKTIYQAEIDAACELIDFWRFNVEFVRKIYDDQPQSGPGMWNQMDYRPLEGFVFAVTPFNFTSIAGNLPTAPALMGNTVVWKPSLTQAFSAHYLMKLFEAAGVPPGVINMVHGPGPELGEAALSHPDLAGIHFTGSTPTFNWMWKKVGDNIAELQGLPADRGGDRRQGLHHRPPRRLRSPSWPRRSCAAASSTRGRSARPRPRSTSRPTCGMS